MTFSVLLQNSNTYGLLTCLYLVSDEHVTRTHGVTGHNQTVTGESVHRVLLMFSAKRDR